MELNISKIKKFDINYEIVSVDDLNNFRFNLPNGFYRTIILGNFLKIKNNMNKTRENFDLHSELFLSQNMGDFFNEIDNQILIFEKKNKYKFDDKNSGHLVALYRMLRKLGYRHYDLIQ